MPELTLSLKDFLAVPEDGLPAGFLRAGISDEDMKSFTTMINGALQGMQWSRLEAAVSNKLCECLDTDPVTLFAATWEKAQELSKAAKSQSSEPIPVDLMDHSVTSTLHPYIEIQIGPAVIRKVEFDVTLSLKLEGVSLVVQSGAIRTIKAGTCEGSAEISIADSSIWKHTTDPIALPGRISLGGGIRIH